MVQEALNEIEKAEQLNNQVNDIEFEEKPQELFEAQEVQDPYVDQAADLQMSENKLNEMTGEKLLIEDQVAA